VLFRSARTITLDDLSNSAIDLVVMDASFISITVLLPSIFDLFTNRPIQILTLIKPQFELERNEIGPGGVVTAPQLHCKAINKIATFVINAGLVHHGAIPSPILGPKGNKEFLMHITGKDYKMD
jgi:23S rRNA (cytidine1920-2'-O)/16S rRNA (cytidine1409-2'-O)-methyltransferase